MISLYKTDAENVYNKYSTSQSLEHQNMIKFMNQSAYGVSASSSMIKDITDHNRGF